MSFKEFSNLSTGGNFVWWTRSVEKGFTRNNYVKIFLNFGPAIF